MALPSVSLVAPLLRVPYVASDALTGEIVASGTPYPTAIRFRVFEKGAAPTDWAEKELVNRAALATEYFTADHLEDGTVYLVQAEASNSEGVSDMVEIEMLWDPTEQLFPTTSAAFTQLDRPWRWDEFFESWMDGLPWYYREDPFTNEVLHRVSQEVERFVAAVEAVDRYAMPSRTYGDGLSRWEDLLGIYPPVALDDERRQAMVLAHLRGRIDASATLFVHNLTQIMGANPRVTENFNAFTVTVDTTNTPEVQALVEEVVNRIIPAHLIVNYNPAVMLLDYPERRQPLFGVWPRGRTTQRPDGFRPGGFDSGGLS